MSTPLANRTTISSRNKLAHGIPIINRESRLHSTTMRQVPTNGTTTTTASISTSTYNKPPDPATSVKFNPNRTRISQLTSRIPPATARVDRRSNAISSSLASTRNPISNSRLAGANGPLNSRSPSVLSSVSSSHTLRQTSSLKDGPRTTTAAINNIPDTNSIRKGLAKFSNPMECQRQFHALNQKLNEMNETLKARDHKVDQLQEQLNGSINKGLCYALIVQYFSKLLKLHCPTDLPTECGMLKCRIDELEVKESKYKEELDIIVNDYQSHIKVEQDLRAIIEKELQDTKLAHAKVLEDLSNAHRDELNDLTDKNSAIQEELSERITTLESDLDLKCKELSELRSNYEALTSSFNKLEESLTKDKDARVKYAQEKVNQLQKDVDSLNSVLEMKVERMHALEKDSILMAETQSELIKQKEISKTLGQQLESLEAALEKRKEQYEILIAEHEKIRQELKHERLDRRRTNVRKSSEIFSTP